MAGQFFTPLSVSKAANDLVNILKDELDSNLDQWVSEEGIITIPESLKEKTDDKIRRMYKEFDFYIDAESSEDYPSGTRSEILRDSKLVDFLNAIYTARQLENESNSFYLQMELIIKIQQHIKDKLFKFFGTLDPEVERRYINSVFYILQNPTEEIKELKYSEKELLERFANQDKKWLKKISSLLRKHAMQEDNNRKGLNPKEYWLNKYYDGEITAEQLKQYIDFPGEEKMAQNKWQKKLAKIRKAQGQEFIITDKQEALRVVKKRPLSLKKVSPELKNDKDVVLTAMASDAWEEIENLPFKYASDKIKDNEKVVLAAMSLAGNSALDVLVLASNRLLDDADFMLKAIKIAFQKVALLERETYDFNNEENALHMMSLITSPKLRYKLLKAYKAQPYAWPIDLSKIDLSESGPIEKNDVEDNDNDDPADFWKREGSSKWQIRKAALTEIIDEIKAPRKHTACTECSGIQREAKTKKKKKKHESSKPAKVIEIADAIRRDNPKMKDATAYRMAWESYCSYINPGYKGCTSKGKSKRKSPKSEYEMRSDTSPDFTLSEIREAFDKYDI